MEYVFLSQISFTYRRLSIFNPVNRVPTPNNGFFSRATCQYLFFTHTFHRNICKYFNLESSFSPFILSPFHIFLPSNPPPVFFLKWYTPVQCIQGVGTRTALFHPIEYFLNWIDNIFTALTCLSYLLRWMVIMNFHVEWPKRELSVAFWFYDNNFKLSEVL